MLSLNPNEGDQFRETAGDELMTGLPGRPPLWAGTLREVDRLETDDAEQLLAYLAAHESEVAEGRYGVGLLLGARGCAQVGDVPIGRPSPVAVPECVAVVLDRAVRDPGAGPFAERLDGARVGEWTTSWTDAEHAAAVQSVRESIARGDVYQANVVGHRSAALAGDPRTLMARLPAGRYRGSVSGQSASGTWWVGCASPEQLVQVRGRRITTVPIKGTAHERGVLAGSVKDHAEHVMIVDLERNDLARVTEPGSVQVEELYALAPWAGLWHASSTVAGRLASDVRIGDVLRAVVPGGSVTGAPKHAACALLADLEPIGRGPAMGALGFWCAEGLDLGLTIRTLAAADGRLHLWAGGGITWSSEPAAEVAEAHAKAAPVLRALAGHHAG